MYGVLNCPDVKTIEFSLYIPIDFSTKLSTANCLEFFKGILAI